MSYDIYLKDPISKQILEVDEPHQMRGGTYQIGGTTKLHFNITYNYAPFYYQHLPKGIRTIYGMSAIDSIPILQEVISKLGDNIHDNYWEATEGNAKRALISLLTMAKMRPDGIWDGD